MSFTRDPRVRPQQARQHGGAVQGQAAAGPSNPPPRTPRYTKAPLGRSHTFNDASPSAGPRLSLPSAMGRPPMTMFDAPAQVVLPSVSRGLVRTSTLEEGQGLDAGGDTDHGPSTSRPQQQSGDATDAESDPLGSDDDLFGDSPDVDAEKENDVQPRTSTPPPQMFLRNTPHTNPMTPPTAQTPPSYAFRNFQDTTASFNGFTSGGAQISTPHSFSRHEGPTMDTIAEAGPIPPAPYTAEPPAHPNGMWSSEVVPPTFAESHQPVSNSQEIVMADPDYDGLPPSYGTLQNQFGNSFQANGYSTLDPSQNPLWQTPEAPVQPAAYHLNPPPSQNYSQLPPVDMGAHPSTYYSGPPPVQGFSQMLPDVTATSPTYYLNPPPTQNFAQLPSSEYHTASQPVQYPFDQSQLQPQPLARHETDDDISHLFGQIGIQPEPLLQNTGYAQAYPGVAGYALAPLVPQPEPYYQPQPLPYAGPSFENYHPFPQPQHSAQVGEVTRLQAEPAAREPTAFELWKVTEIPQPRPTTPKAKPDYRAWLRAHQRSPYRDRDLSTPAVHDRFSRRAEPEREIPLHAYTHVQMMLVCKLSTRRFPRIPGPTIELEEEFLKLRAETRNAAAAARREKQMLRRRKEEMKERQLAEGVKRFSALKQSETEGKPPKTEDVVSPPKPKDKKKKRKHPRPDEGKGVIRSSKRERRMNAPYSTDYKPVSRPSDRERTKDISHWGDRI